MTTSDSIATISPALVKALAEIQNATKNAQNPHYRSSYADLTSVIGTIKPVLSAHGIAVIQSPGMVDGMLSLTTRLLHESGEWVEGVAYSPLAKADPQGVGSAITYLRRYALAAMCGITQEDDDGNAASASPRTSAPAARASTDRPATDKQKGFLDSLISSSVFTDDERDKVRAKMHSGMTASAISSAIEWANAQIKERNDKAEGYGADPYTS